MRSYKDEYQYWLDSPALDEEEWKELSAIADDEKEIESRFYAPLEFGTAGLRGIMATGLNRMNVHVIRWATQAFAEVVKAEGEEAMKKGVVVCYDCRLNSARFAHEAAGVMAANGVRVRIFDELRPTPELSFAVLHYGAQAGINVTASHNPREYNGYKVYWSDGAQLPPQHAAAVAEKMGELDIFKDVKRMDFDEAVGKGLIEIIGAETDEAFLAEVMKMSVNSAVVREVADDFKIVYTPFHGAGHKLVPEALRRLGVKHLFPEPKQMVIDGNFPTVKSPNPENPEGFYLAVDLAKEVGSDLIIGTDPDSDRVGTMVRGKDGEYHTITGNQMGVLLLDYIINARKATGTMPENPAFLKTIVTTNMGREVAERNGVHVDETFTGFKFMAEKLAEYKREGSYNYLLAYEESYGYMVGDYVRDKDAVTASMLIAEMAASYFKQGMTLADALDALYEKYGYFGELTMNLVMPGLDGLEKMRAIMAKLRAEPPKEIGGAAVLGMRDYQSGTVSVAELGVVGKTPIVGSNVLYFELADGTAFIVRPSGTEPKIKVYILAQGESRADCDGRIARYKAFAETLKDLA
ncbi:MAG TPA: phospho-sugar mutase [Candidatus Scatomorpha stercoravium]|nr:phospho-sugar mutase [Candidatus Scatomorpha stercoravium]